MNSPETNNSIANITRNDPEALAKVVGMRDLQSEELESAVDSVPTRSPERGRVGEVLMGLGIVAAAAFFVLPRTSGEMPVPAKNFLERAQDQAQIPLGEGDEIVIDGIRLKPNNVRKDTASEAILGNKDVQAFMEANPREKSGIEQSALVAPTSSEYAIVKRDIDNDGELDAIAVPVESRD